MGNLYEEYGLKNTMENKPFSISFIDSFLDCPYRCFMTYIAGLWPETNGSLPLVFGSGCHSGLEAMNMSIMHEKRNLCNDCPHECKLLPEVDGTLKPFKRRLLRKELREKALDVPIKECAVKRRMLKGFYNEFTETRQNEIFAATKAADPTKSDEEIRERLKEHEEIAEGCMFDMAFRTQPVGMPVLIEQNLQGVIEGTKITGFVDLCLMTDGDTRPEFLLADYKTASPGKETEPLRQLSLYVYLVEKMMEAKDEPLKIDFISALYMIKKKKPAKPRVPFEQTKLKFWDLRKEKDLVDNKINEVREDIKQIQECLHKGVFFKNRRSMGCNWCENKALCYNTRLFEQKLEEKRVKAAMEARQQAQELNE